MLTNSTSRRRVCLARNEHSGKAASPAHHIDFAGSGSACPARQSYESIPHEPSGSAVCRLHRHRLGRQEARRLPARPWAEEARRSVREHRPIAIREWAQKLRDRFGGAPIAVALELAQGPVVSALLEHDIFVLFPVQPTMLAKYRGTFTPSRAKDDPTDAEFALELLLRYPEKLPRLQPESADMRRLRRMVELRRALGDARVAITNRLTSALKGYFPQILGWFRDKDTPVFAAFLERWPTLEAAKRARQETLVSFFRGHNVRSQSTIARRLDAIQSEEPLTTDSAVIGPLLLLVETTIPQLRAVNAAVARFDAEIASLSPNLPDYELFDALPGAGPALAPRLLVAFGETTRAIPRRRLPAEVRGRRPRHRTQWQQELGPLALRVPHLPTPNLHRMGGPNRPSLLLGQSLPPQLPRTWRLPSSCASCSRLQVDPRPSSMLDRAQAVRRSSLSHGPPEASGSAACLCRKGLDLVVAFPSGPPQGLS